MNTNPKAVVDAVVDPKPLTLSRIAMLERIKSPMLAGNVSNFEANTKAVFVCTKPLADVVKATKTDDALEVAALEFADTMTIDEFNTKVIEVLEGIVRFYEMLPRPECDEDGEKKTLD